MASTSADWRHHRSRVAVLTRLHPDRVEEIDDARRALKTARATDYLRDLVTSPPALTVAQREQLAAIVAPAVRR